MTACTLCTGFGGHHDPIAHGNEPEEIATCPDCHHAQHIHESPWGCADCDCRIGYWGGEDDE